MATVTLVNAGTITGERNRSVCPDPVAFDGIDTPFTVISELETELGTLVFEGKTTRIVSPIASVSELNEPVVNFMVRAAAALTVLGAIVDWVTVSAAAEAIARFDVWVE